MPKGFGKRKACTVCGCTEDRGCAPFGCVWVTDRPMLCSGCVTFLMNIRNGNRRTAARKFFGVDRFTSPTTWAANMIKAMARLALAKGAGEEPIEREALAQLAGEEADG